MDIGTDVSVKCEATFIMKESLEKNIWGIYLRGCGCAIPRVSHFPKGRIHSIYPLGFINLCKWVCHTEGNIRL